MKCVTNCWSGVKTRSEHNVATINKKEEESVLLSQEMTLPTTKLSFVSLQWELLSMQFPKKFCSMPSSAIFKCQMMFSWIINSKDLAIFASRVCTIFLSKSHYCELSQCQPFLFLQQFLQNVMSSDQYLRHRNSLTKSDSHEKQFLTDYPHERK